MIVMQYTFQIKPGKFDEAINLAKDGRKNIWPFFSCKISFASSNILFFSASFIHFILISCL